MKTVITILCLIFPVVASAQNQGMEGVDMQKLGLAMQEMMECMSQIDQAALAGLQEKSEQFEQELKELCSQGKRSEAQEKAIAYSKEMMDDPVLKQMQKCGEINEKYGIPQDEEVDSSSFFGEDIESSNRHVCDELDEE